MVRRHSLPERAAEVTPEQTLMADYELPTCRFIIDLVCDTRRLELVHYLIAWHLPSFQCARAIPKLHLNHSCARNQPELTHPHPKKKMLLSLHISNDSLPSIPRENNTVISGTPTLSIPGSPPSTGAGCPNNAQPDTSPARLPNADADRARDGRPFNIGGLPRP